jgi:hypothetical protein
MTIRTGTLIVTILALGQLGCTAPGPGPVELPARDQFLAYELYLHGDKPAAALEPNIFTGYRELGAAHASVRSYKPGQWDIVLDFHPGPYSDYHLDFNNHSGFVEYLDGVPEGQYYIGVYATDPAQPGKLLIYGESAQPGATAGSEQSAAAVRVDVHFDAPEVVDL